MVHENGRTNIVPLPEELREGLERSGGKIGKLQHDPCEMTESLNAVRQIGQPRIDWLKSEAVMEAAYQSKIQESRVSMSRTL